MNLSRVLDSALPEVPQRYRETYFRFNPDTFTREEMTPAGKSLIALTKTRKVLSFTEVQWKLVQMFDGRRSYEQIAALWRRTCGVNCPPDTIRAYAESLDKAGFWHKTPQEETAALMTELMQNRQDRVRRREPGSVTRIYVTVRDIDKQVTWVYGKIKGMYRPAFVWATLIAMVAMIGLWIARWDIVFADSAEYWSMSGKTLWDVAEFYLIFLIVGFFHESGHAVTGKHFGAGIHRTGLMLVYTVPAFFVNLGEVWIAGGRWARIASVLGGFWYEGIVCAIATLVWWGTAVGSNAHDIAYKFILVGGIMPVLFNLNPLVPLDGYLVLCELIRIQGLKEKSTHLLSSWVQKNIFRLPVTVPALPRRRAIFFAAFALLSGVYTYSMLLFLARVTYRLFHNYTPAWAFLPATLVGLRIFKSRIEKFFAFLRTLYLDKRDLMRKHRNRLLAAAAVVVVFALLPLWHETVSAPFILEPAERAVIRAEVPGRVREVLVREGTTVAAGAPLVRLDNYEIESQASRTGTEATIAAARARQAELRHVDLGRTRSELAQRMAQSELARDRQLRLSLDSPISGTVVTARPADLQGSYVAAGTPLVEVDNQSSMRARIFVVEADMRALTALSGHSLHLRSEAGTRQGQFLGVAPASGEIEPGLLPATNIKGLQPPPRYVATVLLPNQDGSLRSGMSGEAKIFGGRRSLAGLVGHPVLDFISRKFW